MKPPSRAPGVARGAVPVKARATAPALTLEEELEGALVDATGGDPPGPALGKRLERVAREILLRRGLGAARVFVSSGPRGTEVRVVLPEAGARVREVCVRVEGAR